MPLPLSSATALAATPREYELVLMLDPGLEDSARDKLADDARKRIDSGGELKHEDSWGTRKMAFEIRQRTEADYRWFRFEAAPEVLEQLDHSLKIADGVLRFRIFRVDPDSPVIAPPTTGASAPREQTPAPAAKEQTPAPAAKEQTPAPAAKEQTPAPAAKE